MNNTDLDKSPEPSPDTDVEQNELRLSLFIGGGMTLGITIGAALDNIGLWLSQGMIFGAALALTLNERSSDSEPGEDGEG